MKPKPIEIIQTSQDGRPTVAATAPTENSTSAGTPLATQNAPVQSIFRCRVAACTCGAVIATESFNAPVSRIGDPAQLSIPGLRRRELNPAAPQKCATEIGCKFRATHSNCFLNSSAISNMSPMMPYLATLKIEAFESVLTATTVSTCFIPARCWIAPEIPIAMYSLQLTAVLPDWPTCRDFGSHPESAIGREHPSVAPTFVASSRNCSMLSSSPTPRPIDRTKSTADTSTSPLASGAMNAPKRARDSGRAGARLRTGGLPGFGSGLKVPVRRQSTTVRLPGKSSSTLTFCP